MRRIAQRLIYFERPDVLPEKTRAALGREIHSRLDPDDDLLPWRTVANAQKELAKLRGDDINGSLAGFIGTVEEFLGRLL